MPVCKYRFALHGLAPHLAKDKEVFVGTIYGQAGFNWMVDEIKSKFDLNNITTFAIGLIPWICRIIEYGKVGVTYGCKELNLVAVSPPNRFAELNDILLKNICERWLKKGSFRQAANFLSLTLSVDNQIIHPSRCYGLFLKYDGKWANKEDIPYFYRDYDQKSADLLQELDADFSKIRDTIKAKYPQQDFQYMLDYLGLERLSYQSENTDIRESFTTSLTLGAIKPPTIQLESGEWIIDKDHRFFTDDIHYGLCIAKWIADQLALDVPTIDSIIDWAQQLRNEKIIEGNRLLLNSESLTSEFMSGIPPVYGLNSIDAILD
jgi:opine dehydrogenase